MGDSAATGGLFNSLRRLLSTALEMLQVRMELLGTELELEKQRILAGLLFGVAAVLVLIVGVVLACGFVILLIGRVTGSRPWACLRCCFSAAECSCCAVPSRDCAAPVAVCLPPVWLS